MFPARTPVLGGSLGCINTNRTVNGQTSSLSKDPLEEASFSVLKASRTKHIIH